MEINPMALPDPIPPPDAYDQSGTDSTPVNTNPETQPKPTVPPIIVQPTNLDNSH